MTKVLFVISAADRWTLNDGTVLGRRGCHALPHLLEGRMGHHRRDPGR
jgi:hypothetical protein